MYTEIKDSSNKYQESNIAKMWWPTDIRIRTYNDATLYVKNIKFILTNIRLDLHTACKLCD